MRSPARPTPTHTRQTFFLPWAPTAKGRPRVTVQNGMAHGYTPAKTRTAEASMRWLCIQQGAVCAEKGVPLAVEFVFRVARPKSAPKRVTLPATRPDLDQYIKLTMDALNGVLWADDAQVVTLVARKVFAASPSDVGVLVRVFEEADAAIVRLM